MPIPRTFIEKNNYESLTSMKVLDRSTGKVSQSFWGLATIGLINVLPYIPNKSCREYSLSSIGKALVGCLSLNHKRLSLKEIELRPGDLTKDFKDYQYYTKEEGFLPNTKILDDVLNIYMASKYSIKSFIQDFENRYPVISYTYEDYCEYILENLNNIFLGYFDEQLNILERYDVDIRNLTTGMNIDKRFAKRGIVYCENVYTLSYTGRLFQRQGLQGISRVSKSILHAGQYNYDIPSSQLTILLQYLEEIYSLFSDRFTVENKTAYLNISLIEEYVDNPEHKNLLLRRMGIPKEQWKVVLYSMLYGANPFSKYRESTIFKIRLANRYNRYFNEELFDSTVKQFSSVFDLWKKYLPLYVDTYTLTPLQKADLEFNSIYLDYKISENCIYNGITFLEKTHPICKDVDKLSSFLLQGLESSFIFHLSLLAPTTIISYEFDGIVVNKEIDESLIEEARRRSGFKKGNVILKDFL